MKMEKRLLSNECIELSRQFIKDFCNRDINKCLDLIDDDFMWIGAFESMYIHGKQEFINAVENINNEKPIKVSNDQYSLLFRNAHLWIVIGSLITSSLQDDGHLLFAKTRCTFVWKRKKDSWILLHIHASHARDIPLEFDSAYQTPDINEYVSWFQYLRKADFNNTKNERIQFRDLHSTTHYLLLSEILYIQSNDKICTIYTFGDNISIRSSLNDLEYLSFLLRVHKSYLVNSYYIKSIKRYQIQLINDVIIPVSQKNYLNIKKQLNLSTHNLI